MKNFWPAGGYLSGDSVATVHCSRESRLTGTPPFLASTQPDSQKPSGP